MARLIVKSLLLPPLDLFVVAFLGLLIRRRWRRLGAVLFWAAALGLVALSLPVVGEGLLHTLEISPALTPATLDPEARAIVVLSAGLDAFAPEYGGATIGRLTLQRVRYGAYLHRWTELPICVSGGMIRPGKPTVAALMKKTLVDEFQVPVRWVESWSINTSQNARFCAETLAKDGIRRIYLVTHGWHMPRARRAFEKAGLEVVPAPTVLHDLSTLHLGDFLPSAKGLEASAYALHEWIGRLWYRIAYR